MQNVKYKNICVYTYVIKYTLVHSYNNSNTNNTNNIKITRIFDKDTKINEKRG